MSSLLNKTSVLTIALVAFVFVLPSCSHRKVVQIGTHSVTVARHGYEKKFSITVNDKGPDATLEYAGVSTDGKGLKVWMRGDDIKINGASGKLKPGDLVFISDEGVAVNDMDYGQSEKYLQLKKAGGDSASLN